MAMNWRPFPCPEKTVSPPPEVPLKLQDVLNWDAVGKSTAFLTTYCSQPAELEFDTRIVGGALKGVVKLILTKAPLTTVVKPEPVVVRPV
jgi:hypothetical protein